MSCQDDAGLLLDALRREVADGLLHAHARLAYDAHKTLEAASFLYALIELLSEKGLITIEDIDQRKHQVSDRLVAKSRREGAGVFVQDPETDKYDFSAETHIDCENRLEFCRAACCRLPFALSKQDIEERVIRWDLAQPYIIAQGKDHYCQHLERSSCRCTVRSQRPVPCRAYDCSKDQTIWLDFANKVINPEILNPDWPRSASVREGAVASND
jgi:hypothetical protein